MNKYAFIAVLIAIIIGFVAGWLITPDNSNEKELIELYKKKMAIQDSIIKNHEEHVVLLKEHVVILDTLLALNKDSLHIALQELNQVKADGVKVEQKLKEFQKLSTDEKARWFIDRYNPKP